MDSALRRSFLRLLANDLAAAAYNDSVRGLPPEFGRIAIYGPEIWEIRRGPAHVDYGIRA